MKRLIVIVVLALSFGVFGNVSAREKQVPDIAGNWLFDIYYSIVDMTFRNLPHEIIQNGRKTIIITDEGDEKRAIIFGDVIMWHYHEGCYPIYYGTIESDDYMSGYMECMRTPEWGQWEAFKVD